MSAEQLDMLKMEDGIFALRRAHDMAAQRIGIGELAHKLDEEPSTLVHQFKRDGKKRPSADSAFWCLILDDEFLRIAAALRGYLLTRPADLTPEEAMRTIELRAISDGFVSKTEVLSLLARMKRSAP
jgi:hypothetical protein